MCKVRVRCRYNIGNHLTGDAGKLTEGLHEVFGEILGYRQMESGHGEE